MFLEKNIELLWAALMSSEDEDLAPRLKKKMSEHELIDTLSRMEREAKSMDVHRAIALFKAMLGGKKTEEEFRQQCLEIEGMM